MEQQTHGENELRMYLLGLLPQERRPPLEERLLTDSEFYEELLITEEELLDEYLAGGLKGRERALFEERFASTEGGRREVRFARALRAYVAGGIAPGGGSAEPSVSPEREVKAAAPRGGFFARLRGPVPAFSLAAALLLLVAGVSWFAVRTLRPREPRAVITVLLTPGGTTRGGGDVTQVVVPGGTDEVRFRLRLTEDGFRSYQATLHGADGTPVLTADGLKPETLADGGPAVTLHVPAQNAPPGDYQLRLSGVSVAGNLESADSYRFKVVSR